MKNIIQNLLIFLGLGLLIVLGYYLYTQNKASILQADSFDRTESVNAALFIRQTNQLKAINLNTDLFSHPHFSRLQDFSEPITPLPIGKANPFSQ